MDGSTTLARLVAEFARISGRLAPDQVRRIVADLAGNRMLEELPVDAFAPLRRVRRRPWPLRFGRRPARLRPGPPDGAGQRRPAVHAAVQGRRAAAVHPGRGRAHGHGRRVRPGRVRLPVVDRRAVGVPDLRLVPHRCRWSCSDSTSSRWPATSSGTRWRPSTPADGCPRPDSWSTSAFRRCSSTPPTCGWPAAARGCSPRCRPGRRAGARRRLRAGRVRRARGGAVGFKLSFAWYINALFNLNPFLALDGYYLLMDWLEVPNLRARGLAWVAARVRRRPPAWSGAGPRGPAGRAVRPARRGLARDRASTSPIACTWTGSAGWSPACGARAGRRACCWSR